MLAALLFFLAALDSSLVVVEAVYYPPNMCYVALWNDGGNVQQQFPLRKDGYNAEQYYGYNLHNGSSANTPDRIEVSNAINYFFFEDGEQLSIFFIFDLPNDGSGGAIQADITTEDLKGKGAKLLLQDDPGDSYSYNDAMGTGAINTVWNPCCTDGMVLSDLPRPPTEADNNFNPNDYRWCVNLAFRSSMGVERYLVRSMTDYYENGGNISMYGANLVNTQISPAEANSLKLCYVQCQCTPDAKLVEPRGIFNSHEVVFGPTGGLGLYRAGEYCSWIFNFVNVSGISFFWSEFLMAEFPGDIVSFYWNSLEEKPSADVVYPRAEDDYDWTTDITSSETVYDDTAPYTYNSLRTPVTTSTISRAYVAFSSAPDSPAHKPGFNLYYIVIPLLESLSATIIEAGTQNVTIDGYNFINGDAKALKCAWRWEDSNNLTIFNATFNSVNSVTCEVPAFVDGNRPYLYVSVSNDGANYFSNELKLSYQICGDGVVIGTEACDDGNTVSNDGCSSNCTIEAVTPPCICQINFVANLLFSLTNLLVSLLNVCPGVTFTRCPGTSATLIGPQCFLVTATETVGATLGLVEAAVVTVVGLLQALPGVVVGTVSSSVVSGCSA